MTTPLITPQTPTPLSSFTQNLSKKVIERSVVAGTIGAYMAGPAGAATGVATASLSTFLGEGAKYLLQDGHKPLSTAAQTGIDVAADVLAVTTGTAVNAIYTSGNVAYNVGKSAVSYGMGRISQFIAGKGLDAAGVPKDHTFREVVSMGVGTAATLSTGMVLDSIDAAYGGPEKQPTPPTDKPNERMTRQANQTENCITRPTCSQLELDTNRNVYTAQFGATVEVPNPDCAVHVRTANPNELCCDDNPVHDGGGTHQGIIECDNGKLGFKLSGYVCRPSIGPNNAPTQCNNVPKPFCDGSDPHQTWADYQASLPEPQRETRQNCNLPSPHPPTPTAANDAGTTETPTCPENPDFDLNAGAAAAGGLVAGALFGAVGALSIEKCVQKKDKPLPSPEQPIDTHASQAYNAHKAGSAEDLQLQERHQYSYLKPEANGNSEEYVVGELDQENPYEFTDDDYSYVRHVTNHAMPYTTSIRTKPHEDTKL